MKAVIFSGGPGTRFWPVSRTHKSKTVAKTFGGKSFLEVTVERLVGFLGAANVYIATGQNHRDFLEKQTPQIPSDNFILEPAYKDTAMAVFNAARFLNAVAPREPLGIFWSDHLVKDIDTFKKGFEIAAQKVTETGKLVYFETPMRFPDVNLGHVKTGRKLASFGEKINLFEFEQFLEKPNAERAEQYFKDQAHYFWNTGYLVTTPKLLLAKYQKYAPEFYSLLNLPVNEAFKKAEKVSFDYAVAEKLTTDDCLVLAADMGWFDVGEWVMVKEAFSKNRKDNVTIQGTSECIDTEDSLIYGQEGKMVALVGLDGVGVIDTPDALLVLNLSDSNKVKTLVNNLKEKGLEKYL